MSARGTLITKWVSSAESESDQDKFGHSTLTVQLNKGRGTESELKCSYGPKGKRVCGGGPEKRLRRMALVQ